MHAYVEKTGREVLDMIYERHIDKVAKCANGWMQENASRLGGESCDAIELGGLDLLRLTI